MKVFFGRQYRYWLACGFVLCIIIKTDSINIPPRISNNTSPTVPVLDASRLWINSSQEATVATSKIDAEDL